MSVHNNRLEELQYQVTNQYQNTLFPRISDDVATRQRYSNEHNMTIPVILPK